MQIKLRNPLYKKPIIPKGTRVISVSRLKVKLTDLGSQKKIQERVLEQYPRFKRLEKSKRKFVFKIKNADVVGF